MGSPGNATSERADVVVTGFQDEVTVNMAVGTWSGLDLRRVCCQEWCVKSTNMGCFVVTVLAHTCALIQPTTHGIASLRAEVDLPSSGSTNGDRMVQLLDHLSYGCVIVQPMHENATIHNAAAGYTHYITIAMQGSAHAEPVILAGTIQVRALEEIIELLQIC